jgi:hypothetical protein
LETTEEKEVELVTIGEILEFAWTKWEGPQISWVRTDSEGTTPEYKLKTLPVVVIAVMIFIVIVAEYDHMLGNV